MGQLLSENPLLLLFLVAALGYFIGNIRIAGNKLGVAAVLFVGLGFGAMNENYNVNDIIFQLGLVLFVYSIGISSGPAFFKSFRTNGFRDIGFVIMMLTMSLLVALLVYYIFSFNANIIAGLYSGATTNTPALAGVIDLISKDGITDSTEAAVQQLVVAYAYSYPMGVIGVMFALVLMEKLFKVDYDKEFTAINHKYKISEELDNLSIDITNPEIVGKTLREINQTHKLNLIFGRFKNTDNEVKLSNWNTELKLGSTIMAIGSLEQLDKATSILGQKSVEKLSYDRTNYEVRRIFVSSPKVVGKRLASLNLQEQFDAVITRVRRGDVDMLASANLMLEQGDRIRFVVNRKELKALSKFFGDSYYNSSQVNIFSFGFGIALGLLIGLIEFSLPGGMSFKLGYAGGPLIVSLILGTLRRTGRLIWTLPYSSNMTLRQVGLTLLLAVIGLKSGNTFIESISSGGGLPIFLGGTFLSFVTAVISIILGYKLFKVPYSLLLGFMSNQPAILDFGANRANNKLPFIGYTLMFPIALVLKIVYAQILYLILL